VIPAQREGAGYNEDAVERTLELTPGYPFYIQEFGKRIWNLAPNSPVTQEDVEHAAPRAEESLDRGIYEVRIQRATAKERRYLRAIAELGAGPYRVGAVATAMGSTTTALSTVRQKLLDRGLIYATEDYGHVNFTVPRFDEFMRRHMSFRPATSRNVGSQEPAAASVTRSRPVTRTRLH
jgi:hypothetical protein